MKPMIVAGIAAVCLISGLYLFSHLMYLHGLALAETAVDIPLWERVLFGMAALWGQFGWLLSPLLLLGCLGVATLYLMFRKSARSV